MSFKKSKFILIILFLSFILSGCSISFNGGDAEGNIRGVFRSNDKGNGWLQKVLIPTVSGNPKSIGGLSVNALTIDPNDYKAIYIGTQDNGLFYSYDRAENWQVAAGLGKVTINAVAVDSGSKCIIYAASGNKVYKSTDCNRSWAQIYYDNDLTVSVNAIAVDAFNSANVYIGTSRGEVIKSSDRGVSWQTVGRFEDDVKKIVVAPHDTKVIFAATKLKGIFRSMDGGGGWVSLSEKLKELKDGERFRDLIVSPSDPGLIILATYYGLLKSADNGNSWSKIELITPEKEAVINAVAIGSKDAKEIYYVTNTTFYRSLDGGSKWTTKKLPTVNAGWKLLVAPDDPNIIYMGIKELKK